MEKREITDMEKQLSRCPYCQTSESIERRAPAQMLGIYAKCTFCGAVAGLDRYKSGSLQGRLYLFWTEGEYAHIREEREPASAIASDSTAKKEGVIA